MSTMLLGQAVAETTGLYGLVVALLLLFVHPLQVLYVYDMMNIFKRKSGDIECGFLFVMMTH